METRWPPGYSFFQVLLSARTYGNVSNVTWTLLFSLQRREQSSVQAVNRLNYTFVTSSLLLSCLPPFLPSHFPPPPSLPLSLSFPYFHSTSGYNELQLSSHKIHPSEVYHSVSFRWDRTPLGWYGCTPVFSGIPTELCDHHHYLILEPYYHPPKKARTYQQSLRIPTFSVHWQQLIYFLSLGICLFWTFHINGITQHVIFKLIFKIFGFFCLALSRSSRVVARIGASLLWMTE